MRVGEPVTYVLIGRLVFAVENSHACEMEAAFFLVLC